MTKSLLPRLLDVFACPGDVFEDVTASAHRLANWLVPTLLVGLTSLLLAATSLSKQPAAGLAGESVHATTAAAAQADALSANWPRVSAVAVWGGAFVGTFWSALVLWVVGRVFLRTRFSYGKALEVAGLTGMIVALGAVVSALLVAASGEPAARPALSLFARHLAAESPLRLVLDGLNLFHLWATAVLAIGLARLAGVSLKESGFWVFGYWLLARMAGVILAC